MNSKNLSFITFLLLAIVGIITIYFALSSVQSKSAKADWEGCRCECELGSDNSLSCTYTGIACPGCLQETQCQPK